jgi:hypothetical protein
MACNFCATVYCFNLDYTTAIATGKMYLSLIANDFPHFMQWTEFRLVNAWNNVTLPVSYSMPNHNLIHTDTRLTSRYEHRTDIST